MINQKILKQQNYLRPIKEKSILIESDISSIFSNIHTIYRANCILLQEIEKAEMDALKISQVFIKTGQALKIYIEYVNNYETAMNTFRKNRSIPAFQKLCNVNKKKYKKLFLFSSSNFFLKIKKEEQKKDPKKNDLPSLLVMPIQRIPRYILLLKEAINHSKVKEEEENLSEAKQKMEELGVLINEKKRETEQLFAIHKLQSQLKNPPFVKNDFF